MRYISRMSKAYIFVGFKPFIKKHKILYDSWPLSKVTCVCFKKCVAVARQVAWAVHSSQSWRVNPRLLSRCWLRHWNPVVVDNYTLISAMHGSLFAIGECQWMNECLYKCSPFKKSQITLNRSIRYCVSFLYSSSLWLPRYDPCGDWLPLTCRATTLEQWILMRYSDKQLFHWVTVKEHILFG